MADQYILGYGVLTVGGTVIGLTRGGGSFTVEREYKQVEADGDYGPVKGRVRKDRSVAMLSFNLLELLSANLPKLYPATELDTTTVPGTATLTAKADVEDADYNDEILWTGKDSEGKTVRITIQNALNLGNLEWTMEDKNEIVTNINWTGTYLSTDRTTEPWKIDYVDAA